MTQKNVQKMSCECPQKRLQRQRFLAIKQRPALILSEREIRGLYFVATTIFAHDKKDIYSARDTA